MQSSGLGLDHTEPQLQTIHANLVGVMEHLFYQFLQLRQAWRLTKRSKSLMAAESLNCHTQHYMEHRCDICTFPLCPGTTIEMRKGERKVRVFTESSQLAGDVEVHCQKPSRAAAHRGFPYRPKWRVSARLSRAFGLLRLLSPLCSNLDLSHLLRRHNYDSWKALPPLLWQSSVAQAFPRHSGALSHGLRDASDPFPARLQSIIKQ